MPRLNNLGTPLQATGGATARLQAKGLHRYGARAIAVQGVVYVAKEDWDQAAALVRQEHGSNAVALGFYLGGNGNTALVPAWTLDEENVRLIRARVLRRRFWFGAYPALRYDDFMERDLWSVRLGAGGPWLWAPRRLARWLARRHFAGTWHWRVQFDRRSSS